MHRFTAGGSGRGAVRVSNSGERKREAGGWRAFPRQEKEGEGRGGGGGGEANGGRSEGGGRVYGEARHMPYARGRAAAVFTRCLLTRARRRQS